MPMFPDRQTMDPIGIACSDESTAIGSIGVKATYRTPHRIHLRKVKASLTSACATGTFTVDIKENGVSILSTLITIDATETTSKTAAVPAVISDHYLADDAEIKPEVTNIGDGAAAGLKVWLEGDRS